MSESNCIAKLLGIKDTNFRFEDKIEDFKKNNITYKRLFATLSYIPSSCHKCKSDKVIKNGNYVSIIKLLSTGGQPTELHLKKQRFLCKECKVTFVANTNEVNPHCFISNSVKQSIKVSLREKISEVDIANRHNVSHSTVGRIVDTGFTRYRLNYKELPENLSFDEFKSVKNCSGKMSFIYVNADTKQLIDIVENRQLADLRTYFYRFSKRAREMVKTVTIDMYSPYMSLIKEIFPNAKIILDKFHLIQLITRALNKNRINVMNSFNKRTLEYKRLKRYWKLILKDETDLDGINFRKYKHFKIWQSQRAIVRETLIVNETLHKDYTAYQLIRNAMEIRDIELFKTIIENYKDLVSTGMKKAFVTLMQHIKYIDNTFKYKYTNGGIEGLNNYIKVFKRVSFGYKSFFHMRNRILIARDMVKLTGISKAAWHKSHGYDLIRT